MCVCKRNIRLIDATVIIALNMLNSTVIRNSLFSCSFVLMISALVYYFLGLVAACTITEVILGFCEHQFLYMVCSISREVCCC